jgi:4-hydroxyphenylpyruvate dioxygenase
MTETFDNPMGLDGFEFVEFAGPGDGVLESVFHMLGFTKVATHRSKDVDLFRQGDVNFVLNREPGSPAAWFAEEHGPGACGMAFRVKDAQSAYRRALDLGARPMDVPAGPMELRLPAISGLGGAPLYLIDRYEPGFSIYDIDFRFLDGVDRNPVGCGFREIDHLTHNVYRGRMDHWARFYERIFNFRETRYFDIKGEYTGLFSRALTSPDGRIRIPLNESADDESQIEEYLRAYKGEGIQHIAVGTDDIYDSTDRLADNGLQFMPGPPEVYYDKSFERVHGHTEPVERMKAHGILIDGEGVVEGGETRILLQVFSKTVIGPIFFEFIQRKGDEGFGEGNFKALFESIEEDQIQRGVLKA